MALQMDFSSCKLLIVNKSNFWIARITTYFDLA